MLLGLLAAVNSRHLRKSSFRIPRAAMTHQLWVGKRPPLAPVVLHFVLWWLLFGARRHELGLICQRQTRRVEWAADVGDSCLAEVHHARRRPLIRIRSRVFSRHAS